MIEFIHPNDLHNHPTNISIYGDTPDPEMLASVQQHGVFGDHPIGYVMDSDRRLIVSGHRRNQAAKVAKLTAVPCVRLVDIEGDQLAIEERIILSNKQRVKTTEQLAREASKLASIISDRAAANTEANLKQNYQKSPENTDWPLEASREENSRQVGRTSERVGQQLGTGEKAARSLIKAGKALEEAEQAGDEKKAERIKEGLAQSPAAGARAAEPDPHEPLESRAVRDAERLLTKVSADFNRAADSLAPLVRSFDEIKSEDKSFEKKHRLLLAHHSRLYQLCEDGKRVLRALLEAWQR